MMIERCKKYEKTLSIQEALYYGFFILLSLAKGLGFYEGQKLFILLTVPALFLGFLKLVLTPYTRRQAILQVLLVGLTAVVYWQSREIGILFLAFTVLGMKGISVKKVLHIGLWVWSACAVALSVFSFFRLEHTIYRVHAKMKMGHIFRWSLGFTHPNILHITYLMLCALIIYELQENYGFRQYILLMLGNLLVFLYSISYTGFGIVAVLLTGCLYVRFRPRFCIIEKMLVNLVLPICLILSFVLPFFLYDYFNLIRFFGMPWVGIWTHRLNNLLNTRIWLAEQFLKSEYRSLFGADISKVVSSSMTLDNSYVWCYINYGLILTGVLMLAYFGLLFYDTHKQRTLELVILISFLAAGWTEPLLFNTSFKNITLVFLGAFLFLQKEGAQEYSLFPRFLERWREIRIPFAALPDTLFFRVRVCYRAHKGRIWGAAAAGMLLGVLLCGLLYREPAGYVVPRRYTDGQEETSVYLESETDPTYAGYRIMNYQDAQTPMQIVAGKAVKLETVRYYTGSALIGGLLGAALGIGMMRKKHEERTAIL
ncbi:MAG: hypothetical protein K2M70_07585 [Lachnospiraceae bacterium]|nr:hypothetical protein [Lachnospiraceae bacterium]